MRGDPKVLSLLLLLALVVLTVGLVVSGEGFILVSSEISELACDLFVSEA